jgi:hypothetical protein
MIAINARKWVTVFACHGILAADIVSMKACRNISIEFGKGQLYLYSTFIFLLKSTAN